MLVLDSLAPWWPDKHGLAEGAKVINIGPDPIFSRFPVRNFRSDVSIAGESAVTIPALISAMEGPGPARSGAGAQQRGVGSGARLRDWALPRWLCRQGQRDALTALKPSPDFTLTAAASRAWSRPVTAADDLPAALQEALAVVRGEKRQAMLDIKVLPD